MNVCIHKLDFSKQYFGKKGGAFQGGLLTIALKAGISFDGSKIGTEDSPADLAVTAEATAFGTLEYKLALFSIAEIINGYNEFNNEVVIPPG